MMDDPKSALDMTTIRNNIQRDQDTVHIKIFDMVGELYSAKHILSPTYLSKFMNDDAVRDVIKQELAKKIAAEIVKSNMIEFSYLQNPNDFTTEVQARCFISKRQQTRLLINELKKNGWDI